jgi:hypothetical protein
MEYHRNSYGTRTFIEHWWGLILIAYVSLPIFVFSALSQLDRDSWLVLCVATIVLQIAGACLIGYAKLPAYRSGRYLSFGVKSVPESRARHYRRGWRWFGIGVLLSLVLIAARVVVGWRRRLVQIRCRPSTFDSPALSWHTSLRSLDSMRKMPNPCALQRGGASRNRCLPCAGSLSLGRWPAPPC